jgi:hypothetical protein
VIFVTLSRWAIRITDKGHSSYAIAVFAVLIINLLLRPGFDRQRIRGDVEAHGGKVIRILYDWFGGDFGRYGRPYNVTYEARRRERRSAACTTSITGRVQWVSGRAPGSIGEIGDDYGES